MASGLINHACIMKPPNKQTKNKKNKKTKRKDLESFHVGEHVAMWGEWLTQRGWKHCTLSPYVALCVSSICYIFLYIFYISSICYIFLYKTHNLVSKMFLYVL